MKRIAHCFCDISPVVCIDLPPVGRGGVEPGERRRSRSGGKPRSKRVCCRGGKCFVLRIDDTRIRRHPRIGNENPISRERRLLYGRHSGDRYRKNAAYRKYVFLFRTDNEFVCKEPSAVCSVWACHSHRSRIDGICDELNHNRIRIVANHRPRRGGRETRCRHRSCTNDFFSIRPGANLDFCIADVGFPKRDSSNDRIICCVARRIRQCKRKHVCVAGILPDYERKTRLAIGTPQQAILVSRRPVIDKSRAKITAVLVFELITRGKHFRGGRIEIQKHSNIKVRSRTRGKRLVVGKRMAHGTKLSVILRWIQTNSTTNGGESGGRHLGRKGKPEVRAENTHHCTAHARPRCRTDADGVIACGSVSICLNIFVCRNITVVLRMKPLIHKHLRVRGGNRAERGNGAENRK